MIFKNLVDEHQLSDLRQMVAPITIEENLQGNNVDDNGRLQIGLRAGPSKCITHALHEISHFIEIDQRRMNRSGWGLKYGQLIEVKNPFGGAPAWWYEYRTDQHIQREIRVWAIQYNLSISRNFKADLLDFAEAAEYLADINIHFKASTTRDRAKMIAAKIEETAAKPEYNIEKILAEFDRRKKILIKRYSKLKQQ